MVAAAVRFPDAHPRPSSRLVSGDRCRACDARRVQQRRRQRGQQEEDASSFRHHLHCSIRHDRSRNGDTRIQIANLDDVADRCIVERRTCRTDGHVAEAEGEAHRRAAFDRVGLAQGTELDGAARQKRAVADLANDLIDTGGIAAGKVRIGDFDFLKLGGIDFLTRIDDLLRHDRIAHIGICGRRQKTSKKTKGNALQSDPLPAIPAKHHVCHPFKITSGSY